MTTARPVEVFGVFLYESPRASVVLLGHSDDVTRVLPVFIGPAEAQAIAIGMQGVQMPRPLTHDLLLGVLEGFDLELRGVEITDIQDGVFHAKLAIGGPVQEARIEARPSDGIALAVRTGVPITVEAAVLDAAGVEIEEPDRRAFGDEEIDAIVAEFHDFLASAEPGDFAQSATDSTEGTGQEPDEERPAADPDGPDP